MRTPGRQNLPLAGRRAGFPVRDSRGAVETPRISSSRRPRAPGLPMMCRLANGFGTWRDVTRIALPIKFNSGVGPDGVLSIVTNPPYEPAEEFIRHALRLIRHFSNTP